MIELRHFEYFVAVAEELHFGRAAERLHMAQPPLSMQIRQLESLLGVQLLVRDRRKVELTRAGEAFLEEARRTLKQARYAMEVAQRAGEGQVGRLHIGFVASAPFNVLPEVLRAYRQAYPAVSIELLEMSTSQQVQALRDRRIDVGFIRLPLEAEGLSQVRVLSEPLVAALPEAHRLAGQRTLDVRDMATESFVLFPRSVGAGLYDQIVGLCVEAGFSPTIGQEASLMQTIVGLVGAGLGVAVVPESVQYIHGTGVVYRPLKKSPLVHMGMVWRTDDTSQILANFREQVPRPG